MASANHGNRDLERSPVGGNMLFLKMTTTAACQAERRRGRAFPLFSLTNSLLFVKGVKIWYI